MSCRVQLHLVASYCMFSFGAWTLITGIEHRLKGEDVQAACKPVSKAGFAMAAAQVDEKRNQVLQRCHIDKS